MIVWSIILSICLNVAIKDIWVICIIGAVLNILIIFWYILRSVSIRKKNYLKIFNIIFKKNNTQIKKNKIKEDIKPAKTYKEKLVCNYLNNEEDVMQNNKTI